VQRYMSLNPGESNECRDGKARWIRASENRRRMQRDEREIQRAGGKEIRGREDADADTFAKNAAASVQQQQVFETFSSSKLELRKLAYSQTHPRFCVRSG